MNKNVILGLLEPYQGKTRILVYDQDTDDIIDGILQTHYQYQKEYEKIYPYFIASNIYTTCRNVWNFVKKNVKYEIESDKKQFIKSPASILATKSSDCKNMSLMCAGILSALQRATGVNIEVGYRFASYSIFDKNYQHVFCVVKTPNREIWVDPVLSEFDERKNPSYYEDIMIEKQPAKIGALVAMAGTNIGADQATITEENAAASAANIIVPGSGAIVSTLSNFLNNLFPSGCQSNDWTGWDGLDQQYNNGILGTQCASHIINIMNGQEGTGTHLQCVVDNVLAYLTNPITNINKVIRPWSTLNAKDAKIDIDINYIVNALSSAGYSAQGQEIFNIYNELNPSPITTITNEPAATGISTTTLLLIGAAILGVYYFSN
jgi:hypothetical protein